MTKMTRISSWPIACAFLLTTPYAFAGSGISTILGDPVTLVMMAVIVGMTAYFAVFRFNRFAVQHGPEILTTLGIFGCFLGISLALLHFDANKVSTSVPQLLEGVKTAFCASLLGVAGSLIIRMRHLRQKSPIPQSEGAPKSASLDDVVGALQALQRNLSGNEEGSLLTQLKLMRQEQSDQLGALRSSFDTFANRMAQDGSKALIEALKEVIRDFNTKINEQFGKNFQELNAAVEKLVVWQQQYRDELDKLQSVQRASAEDLETAASGMNVMVERSAGFVDVADKLDVLLRSLAQQHKLIEESQRSLADVLSEMKEVTPQFSRKLDDLTEAMTNGVRKVQSEVSDVVKNFGVQVQSSSAEMKGLLTDTLKKSQTDVNDELRKSLETIRQGVINLDKGLQEELTKSLETLGQQLASLSEKFVADYAPLTDRLREVVRIAGGGMN
jgi:ABC-type transporter Mla subunit MlaD/multisubunit Na+/H+ antiporter MnhG subunit